MKRGSLVYLTLALVGGVVLALGTLVVWWLTQEDLERARADARTQQAAAERELRALEDILDADVDLVWKPLWHPSMMSDDAKDELGYDEELGMGLGYY